MITPSHLYPDWKQARWDAPQAAVNDAYKIAVQLTALASWREQAQKAKLSGKTTLAATSRRMSLMAPERGRPPTTLQQRFIDLLAVQPELAQLQHCCRLCLGGHPQPEEQEDWAQTLAELPTIEADEVR